MFPINSEPINGEEAYAKFKSFFADQNEATMDRIFNQYVDILVNTDKLRTDGTTLFSGNTNVVIKANRILFAVFLSIIIAMIAVFYWRYDMPKKRVLRFSFPTEWGALKPAQQNAVGSMILSTQFNSLTKFSKNGLLEPDLAVSWQVNSDFTIYTFDINTKRSF